MQYKSKFIVNKHVQKTQLQICYPFLLRKYAMVVMHEIVQKNIEGTMWLAGGFDWEEMSSGQGPRDRSLLPLNIGPKIETLFLNRY